MNANDGTKLVALFCLVTMGAALIFSQRAREMVVGLSGSPALRQHLAGRSLLVANFAPSPTAKFDDYDGFTNTATQIRDDAWLASGFVEYEWRGSRRRDRWFCAFDPRTRDVLALEVGPTREASPEFTRQMEALRHGPRARALPSAASSIERAWGWKAE